MGIFYTCSHKKRAYNADDLLKGLQARFLLMVLQSGLLAPRMYETGKTHARKDQPQFSQTGAHETSSQCLWGIFPHFALSMNNMFFHQNHM